MSDFDALIASLKNDSKEFTVTANSHDNDIRVEHDNVEWLFSGGKFKGIKQKV